MLTDHAPRRVDADEGTPHDRSMLILQYVLALIAAAAAALLAVLN